MSELRAALRQLRRRPAYVVGTALSLAIGISLATAVFSVVRSVLDRPIGVGDADRVGEFHQVSASVDQVLGIGNAKVYTALRDRASAFEAVGASEWRSSAFTSGGRIERVSSRAVTRNMFALERRRIALGRGFEAEDEGQPVLVMSHSLWSTRFAGDTSIVGQTIEIGTEGRAQYGVLGVLSQAADSWNPTQLYYLLPHASVAKAVATSDGGDGMYLDVRVRLAPGVTFEQATAQANAIYTDLYRDDRLRSRRNATIVPIRSSLLGWVREQLEIWIAAAILILLLCAVNFATMSLSRGLRRRGELAVRAALGASRGQVVRALMAEAVVLSLLGGAGAALMGWWLIAFSSYWFTTGDMAVTPAMDPSVVVFAVVAAVVVGFLFAAAPAIELAKVDLRSMLQGDAQATTPKRAESFGRRALVGLQLSLALSAVACVTALTEADGKFRRFALRYDYEPVVFAGFAAEGRAKFDVRPLMERALAQPGVERVAASGMVSRAFVWDRSNAAVSLALSGRASSVGATWFSPVTRNLFDVLGVRLVAGRMPAEGEIESGGTVLVNETLARLVAGSAEQAVGLRLRMKLDSAPREWVTIVGVVPETGGIGGIGLEVPIYVVQEPTQWSTASLVMRVQGNADTRARELDRALSRADPLLASWGVYSASSMLEAARASTRGRSVFLGVTAALALALAVVGVYGMTSYSTELRLREFGIRIALGANARRLARIVLADLWWMAVIAIAIGVFAAGRVTTFLDNLYRPADLEQPLITLPLTPTLAAAATLLVIVAIGTAMPLRRVLTLDVMRTVRGVG